MTNNTLWKNHAGDFGGGLNVYLDYNSADLRMYNNIIRNNSVHAGGYRGDDLYVNSDGNGDGDSAAVSLYNNDLGVDSDFISAYSEDFYITDNDNYKHDANITADPKLNGSGRLSIGSPAIDVGICGRYHVTPLGFEYVRIAPYDDYDGDARPGYGTMLGCDIGADEYKNFFWPMFLPAIISHH